ncbi:MAG: type II toxin-antitoxin system VapC family toxin [Parvularculaceae bacterium]
MYLVDTNVWSELRNRGRCDPKVRLWAESVDRSEHLLSVVTVLELEIGVLRMQRRDQRQGARLREWVDRHVLKPFHKQILPITTDIALRCAELHVPDPRPERDALIAATALTHGLTVVTRNTEDFAPMGVALLNPWLHRSA